MADLWSHSFHLADSHSVRKYHQTGQIIATENTIDLPQMVVIVRDIPLFQGNLGW